MINQQDPMETLITTPHGIITIRPAQETDVQAYRELRLEALHNHPEVFGSDYAVNRAHPMTFWAEKLRDLGDERMMYFAQFDQDLIGTCGIYRGDSPKTQHSATIVGVYVQPAWRGLRIAEGLLASCFDWAHLHEIKIVKLAVVSTNTAAIRRYSSLGFKIYGIEPQAITLNGVMYDEILMSLSL